MKFYEMSRIGKNLALLALMVFAVMATGFKKPAFYGKDAIVGTWWNEEKTSKIEVYKNGDTYEGKIVWLKNQYEDGSDSKPNLDDKNPDESLRSREIMGLVILTGLEWDDDEWDDGTIYDPKKGDTYSCYAEFEDENDLNTLKFRGFIGISLIGRTSYWTRVQ